MEPGTLNHEIHYVRCLHLGRGPNLLVSKAWMPKNVLNHLRFLNRRGFRPFHDAKGPVIPSIGIRLSFDRNGYS